jgi:hypothetical protein
LLHCCDDAQAVGKFGGYSDELLQVTGWHPSTLDDALFFV